MSAIEVLKEKAEQAKDKAAEAKDKTEQPEPLCFTNLYFAVYRIP